LVDSAYTMELLAGVYAHLTTDRGTIHSDCTSAISTIKKWLLGWKVSVRDVGILNLLTRGVDVMINTHVHQRAHPERRLRDRGDWDAHDQGIFAADRVAADDGTWNTGWKAVSQNLVVGHQQDRQVMQRYQTGTVLVTHNHEILYTEPLKRMQDRRLMEYVTLRDEYTTGSWRWRRLTHKWAGVLAKPCTNMAEHAAIVRIIWDKTWHGRNQAKEGKGTAMCRLCEAACEDQTHILINCPSLQRARRSALQLVDDTIATLSAVPERRWLTPFLEVPRLQSCTEGGVGWWIGMCSHEALDDFTNRTRNMVRPPSTKVLIRALKKMGRAFQAGALAIYRERRERLDLLDADAEQEHVEGGRRDRGFTPHIAAYFRPLDGEATGARVPFHLMPRRREPVDRRLKHIGRLPQAGTALGGTRTQYRQISMLAYAKRVGMEDEGETATRQKKKRRVSRSGAVDGSSAGLPAPDSVLGVGRPLKATKASKQLHRKPEIDAVVRLRVQQLREKVEAGLLGCRQHGSLGGPQKATREASVDDAGGETQAENFGTQQHGTQQYGTQQRTQQRTQVEMAFDPLRCAQWVDPEPPDPH
jgi:hypothetical protein